MDDSLHRCLKLSGGTRSIKYGKTRDGRQCYKCKVCGKRYLKSYTYKAYEESINTNIQNFLKEGVGIRSISRLCGVFDKTVLLWVFDFVRNITKPFIVKRQVY